MLHCSYAFPATIRGTRGYSCPDGRRLCSSNGIPRTVRPQKNAHLRINLRIRLCGAAIITTSTVQAQLAVKETALQAPTKSPSGRGRRVWLQSGIIEGVAVWAFDHGPRHLARQARSRRRSSVCKAAIRRLSPGSNPFSRAHQPPRALAFGFGLARHA